MNAPRFIAFEGGEGCGKSTQAAALRDFLAERGIPAELTREPGGTPGAEAIRRLLLQPPGPGWTAEAEALLFAAARADHVARRIRPALEGGRWVICDRFLDSSRAYQGAAGGMGDTAILALHEFGSAGLVPDCTILLTVGEDEARARTRRRDGGAQDAIGGRDRAYHAKVAAAFADLALSSPQRYRVVEASGSPQDVHQRVLAAIEPWLPPC